MPPPPPPPGPYWWGWDDDPFWDAAAVGIVAGTTAAVVASAAQPSTTVVIADPTVGSTVYVLPSNCPQVVRSNVTYYSCNNIWYKPQYLGSGVTYLVVAPPG